MPRAKPASRSASEDHGFKDKIADLRQIKVLDADCALRNWKQNPEPIIKALSNFVEPGPANVVLSACRNAGKAPAKDRSAFSSGVLGAMRAEARRLASSLKAKESDDELIADVIGFLTKVAQD